MGADNMAQLTEWEDWQTILRSTPVGVIGRPGERMAARMSPAAHAFRRYQLPESRSRELGRLAPPAWCVVNVPLNDASSTAIRQSGRW